MLDESMFEDIHEIAENSAYLKAVEEKDVSLEMLEQLPAYDELKELEEGLRQQKMLTFQNIFNEPTGYYMIKCFLIADYAVDKAIFIKDVEAYKSMRFESARRKIAKLLYQRFVSPDSENDHKQFPKGSSVFQLIRQERAADAADEKSMAHGIDSKAGMQTGAAGGIASVGTPTGQAMGQNIQVPGAANTNNSTSAMAAASPAATGGNGVGVLTPSGPNSLPLNASGPGAAAAAAMLNPSPGGGVGGGAGLVGSPPHGNGGVAMTKLGPGGAAAANGSLSSDAKGPNHKPSGSADKLAVGPGPDKAQAQDQHLTAAGAASPTQPGRSSHTAITMNITSAAGTSAAPGDHSIVTKADPSSKEPEKTVISSTGHVTTQTLHSHNGPHSATHGTMKVVGGGLGSASSATTGAGGERVEFQIGNTNNAIGVYGKMVKKVRERVQKGEAPKDLFDEVAQQVMNDLKLDVFPRFKQSDFYKKYIRTKSIETMKVSIKDFTTFRVLGRGGFGAVHACRKTNSGTLYAMKCINKKLVKVKSALDNVLEERNVLTMMKSNFVTNLKYALQDDETLYLIMDLMLGGDLKFHLINAGRFTEKRARFYAAEVLLGLEHVHNASIIYRDMKLENVLLDHLGHCRISDLGLAVVTKTKIKGYAGTPGYTAPEMIKNKLYGPSADIFSFGVMLYRMLCGSKPFKGKIDRDLDKAVVDRKPQFPKEIFSKDAILLLTGLLHKRPENRLGCNEKGIEEIKDHPFFESIDWGLLEAGYLDPPFVPNKFDVNAASLKDIGDFDKTKYKNVKLDERFKQRVKNFHFVSIRALQDEMVSVLEKADENVNFEKFAPTHPELKAAQATPVAKCCVML